MRLPQLLHRWQNFLTRESQILHLQVLILLSFSQSITILWRVVCGAGASVADTVEVVEGSLMVCWVSGCGAMVMVDFGVSKIPKDMAMHELVYSLLELTGTLPFVVPAMKTIRT